MTPCRPPWMGPGRRGPVRGVHGPSGHRREAAPWMSTEVITHTTGIDVMLDGHSHSVLDSERVKNKDGKEVLLSSTGTKFQSIGLLRISGRAFHLAAEMECRNR